jgi:hypothetical protein
MGSLRRALRRADRGLTLSRVLINAQIAAGYVLALRLRYGYAQSFMEHHGGLFDKDRNEA